MIRSILFLTAKAAPVSHWMQCTVVGVLKAGTVFSGLLFMGLLFIGPVVAQDSRTVDPNPPAYEVVVNPLPTALDEYVAKPDPSYRYEIVRRVELPNGTAWVIDLVSQTWLTPAEVNRTEWRHWLTIFRPKNCQSDTAMIFVAGGSNEKPAPETAEPQIVAIAQATHSVVAELKMVPNQPLIFHDDGQPRVEDDLIAYTWDQFLKTGDAKWPAQLPMTKSVVRAMDTVQTVLAQDEKTLAVEKFVVTGGSKRGWTTWLTASVDPRVVAIAPIVIDVLNVDVSMRHHFATYGFWAPAIDDYVHHKIMERRSVQNYPKLLQLVDPFAYRDRLQMPKCVINATGDQFFCPDSSQFYFDQLPGENHLCYVPNSEHSLKETNALDSLIAFHYSVVHQVERPKLEWESQGPGQWTIRCQPLAPGQSLRHMTLWQTENATSRDFRVDTIGRSYKSQRLEADANGIYHVQLPIPSKGWTASFVQAEFDIGAPTPLRVSTPVTILPLDLPHHDKPMGSN
ncbi:MAG: PhoPQ-activated pathogenicity-related family protein [Planctomycetaceae bacterium]|nr:PhoPQ-activated pathogenicity-related family protein [Planctomycetaceae bacterium]